MLQWMPGRLRRATVYRLQDRVVAYDRRLHLATTSKHTSPSATRNLYFAPKLFTLLHYISAKHSVSVAGQQVQRL